MTTLRSIDQGAGTPLLWIHGFPLSSLIFEQQLEIEGVRHVAPDLPGFGETPPTSIASIDDYAALLVATLKERHIDRAVIAGVSMGGYISLSIARRHPEIAAALILVDTRETPDTPEAKQNRNAQSKRVDSEGTAFLVDEMLPKMLTRATLEEGDRREAIVRQAMQSGTPEGVKSALAAMASRSDSADVLRTFEGPILIAVGDHDQITPQSDARRMASLSSHAQVVTIADAAHLSNVERPEVFNAAVRSFVERIS